MRVLICGGRNFTDYQTVCNVMSDFCVDNRLLDDNGILPEILIIIHGKARGADLLGDKWAVNSWCRVEEYPADWEKYGKRAGLIRNQQMLDTGIDYVIAFPDKNSRGTYHMIDIARKAGVPVLVNPPQ